MEVYLKFVDVITKYRDMSEDSTLLKEESYICNNLNSQEKINIINGDEILIFGNQFYKNQLLIDLHKLPYDLKNNITELITQNLSN